MSAFEIENECGAASPLNDRVREECMTSFKSLRFCRYNKVDI